MARSFSSGVSVVSPLGVTLPTEGRRRVDFGADVDDARLVGRQLLLARLGMSRVISSLPSLVSRAITTSSSMWIEVSGPRRRRVRDQDRVFEVVAVPGHERDQHVLAEGQFAQVGAGAVGHHVALGHHVARLTIGRWWMLVFWLERWYLIQVVDVDADFAGRRLGVVDADDDAVGVDVVDLAARRAVTTVPGSTATDPRLDAGADQRLLGTQAGTA